MDVDGLTARSRVGSPRNEIRTQERRDLCGIVSQMWVQCEPLMTALLLRRRAEPVRLAKEWFSSQVLLEAATPEQLEKKSERGCILTHLPFDRMNYSRDAKYIYITRHPSDCMVSYYHFVNYLPYHDTSLTSTLSSNSFSWASWTTMISSTICCPGTSRGICPTCCPDVRIHKEGPEGCDS